MLIGAVFGLVRTKVAFNAYFSGTPPKLEHKIVNGKIVSEDTGAVEPDKCDVGKVIRKINIGGELIDVSIPHKNDDSSLHFYKTMNKNITTYTIKSIGTEPFVFKAYTFQYLIDDIERMLFIEQVYPWIDVKYGKRIVRLMFMYFVTLLVNKDMSYADKVSYVSNISEGIFKKVVRFAFMGDNNKSEIMSNIDNFLANGNDENMGMYPFRVLIKNLKEMLSKDVDLKELQKYAQMLFDGTQKIINVLKVIMIHNGESGVDDINIRDGSILWGGDDMFKNKYMKYKNKYLKLKHAH